MINNSSVVEKDLNSDGRSLFLSSEMVPLEKSYQVGHTSKIPQSNFQTSSNFTEVSSQFVYLEDSALAGNRTFKTKDIRPLPNETVCRERVKVQHLQTHTKLQNNPCNYEKFYNLINEAEKDATNNNNNNNDNNNSNSTSAFNECYYVNDQKTGNSPTCAENKNQNVSDSIVSSDKHELPIHRTEDQENAFRRIEDVHNYAKLNRYNCSNGSSNSSVHDEEEEEEVDDVEEEFLNNGEDLDAGYERYFTSRRPYISKKKSPQHNLTGGKAVTVESKPHANNEKTPQEQDASEASATITPDHHARRPMNAFLIFCKRHRGIVKAKYKSLENRAITKILGEWWASLDVNDKKAFTNLAQQNKDAFFSANPNFKWYKLPAPPLRTLNTRPSNAERTVEHERDFELPSLPHNSAKSKPDNFFKLADEAQMGDLSVLMSEKNMNQQALQQALGETTQFLNTHMPSSLDPFDDVKKDRSHKRRVHSENSFSSNSSEDDGVPKKSSRSCKGKIYQELINSGQIAAITKKAKNPKTASCVQSGEHNEMCRPEMSSGYNQTSTFTREDSAASELPESDGNTFSKQSVHEFEGSHHEDLGNFDLEEKIKALPALNLDAYLQRKRNTKKKKKFSSKKRNSNSTSSNKSSSSVTVRSPPVVSPKEMREPLQQAVGSQKRKARKESITRRDVSAIESEVATINGCYFFNETTINKLETPSADSYTEAGCTAPLASSTMGQFSSALNNLNDNISSTSDLHILAEVAAIRTELAN